MATPSPGFWKPTQQAPANALTGGGKPGDIGLVSLSTTLATNAVVEGVGGRVGLVMIGFDEAALERADLARALGQDPVAFINGGHSPDGGAQTMLDRDALRNTAAALGSEVLAFAIAGHFATRNPEHEIAARDLLRELTGLPITCSHELSSALIPRRFDNGAECTADQSAGTANRGDGSDHDGTGANLSVNGGQG